MSDNLKTVLKQIFLYHKLENEIELKQVWFEDLKFYSDKEVKSAWDKYRQDELNDNRKPKSWDLVKIIKKNRTQNFQPKTQQENFVEDENFKIMEKNMPGFMDGVRTAHSPYEKILICATALGKPELMKTKLMTGIVRKLSNSEFEN